MEAVAFPHVHTVGGKPENSHTCTAFKLENYRIPPETQPPQAENIVFFTKPCAQHECLKRARIERSSKTSSYWGDWSNCSEFVLKYMLVLH